jgi:5-methylcytosine-specific restriction endonuclease McrA
MIKLNRNNTAAAKLFLAILDHLESTSSQVSGLEDLHQSLITDRALTVERLKLIITASPENLRAIKSNGRDYKDIKKWNFKELYKKFSSRSNKVGDDTHSYTAIEMVEDMGITVCPYCNRQYINNMSNLKGKRRSSQLDHFYPKSKYAYMALSYFNLFPVCPSCNLIKSTIDLKKSPYEIETDDYITFDFTPTASDFLTNEKSIRIDLTEEVTGKNSYREVLALDEHYQVHREYVKDILNRKQLYDTTYIEKELLGKVLKPLFKDNDLKRIIWGNYTEDGDQHKRPLAKLTRDILKKIEPSIFKDEE